MVHNYHVLVLNTFLVGDGREAARKFPNEGVQNNQ